MHIVEMNVDVDVRTRLLLVSLGRLVRVRVCWVELALLLRLDPLGTFGWLLRRTSLRLHLINKYENIIF